MIYPYSGGLFSRASCSLCPHPSPPSASSPDWFPFLRLSLPLPHHVLPLALSTLSLPTDTLTHQISPSSPPPKPLYTYPNLYHPSPFTLTPILPYPFFCFVPSSGFEFSLAKKNKVLSLGLVQVPHELGGTLHGVIDRLVHAHLYPLSYYRSIIRLVSTHCFSLSCDRSS